MNVLWELSNLYFHWLNKLEEWFQSRRLKKKRKRENHFVNWGLGVDAPYFFSSKFTIENNSITIIGSQKMLNNSWPVRYSIVKMGNLGLSIKYFDNIVFYGNHSGDGFKHTFNVPSGTGYRLEVYNYFKCLSSGKYRILQNETEKC